MGSIPEDYYAVLGVPTSATQKEISRAFRTLMRTRHPDVDAAAATPTSSEVLGIMRAFSVLKDPKKRAEYDRAGRVRPGYERAGSDRSGTASARADSARTGQSSSEGPAHRVPKDVPVQHGPLDIPVHKKPAPSPLFRISPVKWEQGPWTGRGDAKRRRTT
jgi:curved DNA-binding protein CbpA